CPSESGLQSARKIPFRSTSNRRGSEPRHDASSHSFRPLSSADTWTWRHGNSRRLHAAAAFAGSLSQLPPTISRPCGWCFSYNAFSLGILLMHGVHHVAQQSISTTLPRKSVERSFVPSVAVSVKSYGLPISGNGSTSIPADFASFRAFWATIFW